MVGVSIINLGRHCPGRPAGDTQETLMPSRPTRATGAFSSQSLIKRGLLPSQFTQLWRFQLQGSDQQPSVGFSPSEPSFPNPAFDHGDNSASEALGGHSPQKKGHLSEAGGWMDAWSLLSQIS